MRGQEWERGMASPTKGWLCRAHKQEDPSDLLPQLPQEAAALWPWWIRVATAALLALSQKPVCSCTATGVSETLRGDASVATAAKHLLVAWYQCKWCPLHGFFSEEVSWKVNTPPTASEEHTADLSSSREITTEGLFVEWPPQPGATLDHPPGQCWAWRKQAKAVAMAGYITTVRMHFCTQYSDAGVFFNCIFCCTAVAPWAPGLRMERKEMLQCWQKRFLDTGSLIKGKKE